MNKEKAESWQREITQLLAGKKLIHTASLHGRIEVYQNCVFEKAYLVDYKDGRYAIGLSAGGWTMTGCSEWLINPDKRTIQATTQNGYGDTCLFAWTLAYDNDRSDNSYYAMRDAQERLWRV